MDSIYSMRARRGTTSLDVRHPASFRGNYGKTSICRLDLRTVESLR